MGTNSWDEWQNHVLAELNRLNTTIQDMAHDSMSGHEVIKEEFSVIKSEIAVLKFKAGVWGAVAGLTPGVLVLLYFVVKMVF